MAAALPGKAVEMAPMRREAAEFTQAYFSSQAWVDTRWKGRRVEKCPLDLMLHQELIFLNKPEIIVETGTRYGGSAAFFADMMKLAHGDDEVRVISVDVCPLIPPQEVNAMFIQGNSVDPTVVAQVANLVAGKRTMVILDSDHSETHVAAELAAYAPLVSVGQSLVVEDTLFCPGAAEAVAKWHTGRTAHVFPEDPMGEKYLATWFSWFRRVA